MTTWMLGFGLAAVVVVIVAALLLGIIWQCQRIVRLARTGLAVVEQIDANTCCIWSLRQTRAVAGQLLEGAGAIERNAAAIVDAVSHGSGDRAA
jgi:uncharacterized membrane protein YqjE